MRYFMALLMLAGAAGGQEQEVRAAERSWAKAVMAKDAAALGRILGDQLIYGHSTGVVDTKSDYIGKLNSGKQKYEGIEHQSMEVRMYGGTAVVHARVHMWGVNPDGKFDDRLMMLHVWLKTGSTWQLVGHQTSRLK